MKSTPSTPLPGQNYLSQAPSDPSKTATAAPSIPTLKPRAAIHWARRIWHVSGVLAVATIYHFVSYQVALGLLTIGIVTVAIPDILRLKIPSLNQFILKRFRWILRECEIDQVSGVTYILLGIFISVALFPKPIVELSLLLLAFGDPAATIFGVRFGKDKIWRNKSLQGTIAAFLVCALVAYVYLLFNSIMLERALLMSLLCGLIGALSEIIPFGKWDDNFSFPVLSSTMLFFLFLTFGGFV